MKQANRKYVAPSLINRIKVLIQNLVHRKHMNAVRLEYGAQRAVAANLALIVRVLEVVRLDVLPDLLDGLRARELGFAKKV